MTTRTTLFLIILISIFSLAAGWAAYPYLPEKIATHWDALGQANGFSSRNFALTFLPILTLALGIFMLLLPRIDPLRANLAGFLGTYHAMVVVTAGFMLYMQAVTLLLNLGWQANLVTLLIPAFAVLFFFTGLLVERARRNWFIGIRNPWTLSSDYVWEKTHRLGGLLFKLCAILCLAGFLFPKIAFFFMIVPAVSIAIILMVYSYLVYRQLAK